MNLRHIEVLTEVQSMILAEREMYQSKEGILFAAEAAAINARIALCDYFYQCIQNLKEREVMSIEDSPGDSQCDMRVEHLYVGQKGFVKFQSDVNTWVRLVEVKAVHKRVIVLWCEDWQELVHVCKDDIVWIETLPPDEDG